MVPYTSSGKFPALILACVSELITVPLSMFASFVQTQYEVVATAPLSPEGDQLGIFGCTFYGLSVSASRGKRLARLRVICACVRLSYGNRTCCSVDEGACGGTGGVVTIHNETNGLPSIGFDRWKKKNHVKAVGIERVDDLCISDHCCDSRDFLRKLKRSALLLPFCKFKAFGHTRKVAKCTLFVIDIV